MAADRTKQIEERRSKGKTLANTIMQRKSFVSRMLAAVLSVSSVVSMLSPLALASSAADVTAEPDQVAERSVVAVSELLATTEQWESEECTAVYMTKDKDGNYVVSNYDKKDIGDKDEYGITPVVLEADEAVAIAINGDEVALDVASKDGSVYMGTDYKAVEVPQKETINAGEYVSDGVLYVFGGEQTKIYGIELGEKTLLDSLKTDAVDRINPKAPVEIEAETAEPADQEIDVDLEPEESATEEAAPVDKAPETTPAEGTTEEAAPVEVTTEEAAPVEETQETPVDVPDEQGTDEVQLGTALSAFKAGMKVGKAAEWIEKGELTAIAYFQHENGQNSLIDFAGGKDDPVLLAENNALLLAVTEADQRSVQVQMESGSDQAYVLVGEGKEKVFLDREDHIYDLTEYLTEDNILAIFGGNADVAVVSVIFEDAQLKAMNLEGAQAIVDAAFSVEDPASDIEPEDESNELTMPAFSESVTVDDVVVSVKADSDVFPEDATLSVTKVPAKEQTQAAEAVDGKREDGQNVAVSYTFDIKVLDADGNEIQPADGKKVHVSFSTAEVADQNLKTQVYHIAEEANGAVTAEKLDVHESGNTATAQTDGFSLYTVEFTYDNLQYVMQGDTSVALADILKKIGLTGEATAVEVSSPDLFSASNETGEWIVTAHQAFTSTEWMKVTINGVVYEIVVTDAANWAFHNHGGSWGESSGGQAIYYPGGEADDCNESVFSATLGSDTKVAYCLDRYKDSPSGSYTNATWPSSNPYKIAKQALVVGYPNNSVAILKEMFNAAPTTNENKRARLATQTAIAVAQQNVGGVSNNLHSGWGIDKIYSDRVTNNDNQTWTLSRAIARRAYDVYHNPSHASSFTSIAETSRTNTAETTTLEIAITPHYVLGQYNITITGLPDGSKLKTGANITLDGTNKSPDAGTAVKGSKTIRGHAGANDGNHVGKITLIVPRGSSNVNIGVAVESRGKLVPAANSTFIMGSPANSSCQPMAVAGLGEAQKVSLSNSFTIPAIPVGSIKVKKIDSTTGLARQGAEFTLYQSKDNTWNNWVYVDKKPTGPDGTVTFSGLTCNGTNGGLFQVKETGAPAGYVCDGNFYANVRLTAGTWHYKSSFVTTEMNDVSPGKLTSKSYNATIGGRSVTVASAGAMNSTGALDVTFTAADKPDPKFNITVNKRDLNTGNAVTSGVKYQLYRKVNGSWTAWRDAVGINSNGVATWQDLDPSESSDKTFMVKEVEVTNTNYVKDDKFEVIVNPDSGKMIYASSLVAKKEVTADGTEVKADVNLLNGNTASRTIMKGVKDNSDGQYDFTIWQDDQHDVHQNLSVSKIVKVDGTNRMISGMTFTLMHKKSNNAWEPVGTLNEPNPTRNPGLYAARKNGDEWAYPMVFGDFYRVDETAVPSGIVNSGWHSNEFQWQKMTDINLNYTAENHEPKGYLGVQKVNKETGAALSGVEFTVTAAGDIQTTVGGSTKTWYTNGAQVAKGVTNVNGFFKVENLPYGTYTVTETKHPDEFHYEDISFNVTIGNPAGYSGSTIYTNPHIGVPTYPAGMATKADGSYTYVVVNNNPVHPSTSVAKLTERTLNPNGRVVAFDATTGRYTEEKIPGTYYNDQRAKFTLTATNTGDVDLYDLNMKDVMSPELWTTVKRLEGARTSDVTFRQVNNEPLALGAELKTGSTITTTKGKTVTVTNVTYDDANRTFNIWFDKLEIGDSFNIQITYTLYNNDNINKQNLPNDVYLYAKYLKQGTRGDKNNVPEDPVLHHDVDKLNVVCQGEISVEKKDNKGNALKDVHFQLVDAQNNAVQFVHKDDGSYSATVTKDNGDWVSAAESGKPTTTDLITNASGKVEIVELPEGDYKLVETKTVEGQTLMAQPVEIKMPFTEAGAEKTDVDHNIYFDGINHYYHQYYSITNTAVFKLPSTGAVNRMPMFSIAGFAGLCAIAVATVLRKRKED